MLTEYIEAAMRHARIERLPESGQYYGEIPETPGVWATGARTLTVIAYFLSPSPPASTNTKRSRLPVYGRGGEHERPATH